MIADLKTYPAMKDSGVEWLGDVPETWEVRRNGRLFAERNETGFAELPILEVSLRTGVRVRDFENSDRKQVMSDRDKYKRAVAGDIAYNMMRMWQGAVGVAPVDGLISPAYVVARPLPGTEPRYYERLFRTPMYMQEVDGFSRGIVKDRNRLYWEDFKAIPTCYPPPAEQAAIVRYLDHLDLRVRQLVRAKRQLIALLDEQKQVVVHQAVTRGLDPDVALKGTGIAWLGEVPEHWDVRRLRSLANIRTGDRDTANRVDDGQYPFFVRSQTVERINSWAFDGEAVLTAGDGAGVAKVFHYVNGKFDYHQRVYKFSGFREVLGRFFFEYVRATLHFEALAGNAKSTVDSLRLPMLKNFPVVVPPLEEQHTIVEYLREAAKSVDAATARARREIELLGEYRVRLMADVVTGKIDVRGAAAELPDVDPLAGGEVSDGLDIESEEDLEELDGTVTEAGA